MAAAGESRPSRIRIASYKVADPQNAGDLSELHRQSAAAERTRDLIGRLRSLEPQLPDHLPMVSEPSGVVHRVMTEVWGIDGKDNIHGTCVRRLDILYAEHLRASADGRLPNIVRGVNGFQLVIGYLESIPWETVPDLVSTVQTKIVRLVDELEAVCNTPPPKKQTNCVNASNKSTKPPPKSTKPPSKLSQTSSKERQDAGGSSAGSAGGERKKKQKTSGLQEKMDAIFNAKFLPQAKKSRKNKKKKKSGSSHRDSGSDSDDRDYTLPKNLATLSEEDEDDDIESDVATKAGRKRKAADISDNEQSPGDGGDMYAEVYTDTIRLEP
ncbi:unnamed protein product [Mycena citricolor]|uniref:Uncharacterized protein n=1 Tax=Mycena citricolor TaxID=2018698 RepID=A0AAD2K7K2_9AGAR|nr:unnamed protein product [Mycena citricolor]